MRMLSMQEKKKRRKQVVPNILVIHHNTPIPIDFFQHADCVVPFSQEKREIYVCFSARREAKESNNPFIVSFFVFSRESAQRITEKSRSSQS